MIQIIPVGLGARAYDVVVGTGLIDRAGERIAPLLKRKRVAIVTDTIVGEHHGERLAAALEHAGVATDVILVPPGEETKSFEGLADLSDRLLALGLERGDMVVAFGGGVVGDLTGFAASIYKRGVDFIQIPTTLLAQVDSSVGGKTAIDTPRGKNLIGAFHQPRLVLADLDILATLPARELACGYAEIIKYGLLGDFAFFEWLEANVKAVLERDTAALVRAEAAIKAAGLPTRMSDVRPEPFNADALVAHCGQDKKAEGGTLTFVLVRRIGDAFVAKDVDREALKAFLMEEGAV